VTFTKNKIRKKNYKIQKYMKRLSTLCSCRLENWSLRKSIEAEYPISSSHNFSKTLSSNTSKDIYKRTNRKHLLLLENSTSGTVNVAIHLSLRQTYGRSLFRWKLAEAANHVRTGFSKMCILQTTTHTHTHTHTQQ